MPVPVIYPVILDGPLEDAELGVSPAHVHQGSYVHSPEIIYTFTRVQLLGRVVVVASASGGIPPMELLFEKLASQGAHRAAE